jgi:hypothetical protein
MRGPRRKDDADAEVISLPEVLGAQRLGRDVGEGLEIARFKFRHKMMELGREALDPAESIHPWVGEQGQRALERLPDDAPGVLEVPSVDVIEGGKVLIILREHATDRDDSLATPHQYDIAWVHLVVEPAQRGLPLIMLGCICSAVTRTNEHDVVFEKDVGVVASAFARRDLPEFLFLHVATISRRGGHGHRTERMVLDPSQAAHRGRFTRMAHGRGRSCPSGTRAPAFMITKGRSSTRSCPLPSCSMTCRVPMP